MLINLWSNSSHYTHKSKLHINVVFFRENFKESFLNLNLENLAAFYIKPGKVNTVADIRGDIGVIYPPP